MLIEETVLNILRNVTNDNHLELHTELNEIDGWDSMSFAEALVQMESFFAVELQFEGLVVARAVDFVKLVRKGTSKEGQGRS